MPEFSNRLKALREEMKITQADLADKIGLKRTSISGYETGRKEPEFGTLIKIADFFDVSIDYLLGRTDIRCSYSQEHAAFSAIDKDIINLINKKIWLKDTILALDTFNDDMLKAFNSFLHTIKQEE